MITINGVNKTMMKIMMKRTREKIDCLQTVAKIIRKVMKLIETP
jgi:hypothetical protein